MAKITKISVQEKRKERCNLFIDGEFYAGISCETVIKNHLKVGQELTESKLKVLLIEGERIDALNKAINYISKALKTKKQMFTYLTGKGYSEDTAFFVIDKLKDYGYIDDRNYAKRYIETYSKNQGRKLIEFKLMQKGVKKEDISFAFDEIEVPSKENATFVLQKYMRNKEKTQEIKAKAYRYLAGKGFGYDEISYAVSSVFGDD